MAWNESNEVNILCETHTHTNTYSTAIPWDKWAHTQTNRHIHTHDL